MKEISANSTAKDQPLGILGLDHLEFWVGNPRHAAHFYHTTFGLTPRAYAGLETGEREKCAYVLGSHCPRLVVSGAMTADSTIADFVNTHGDGVRDVAFRVKSAEHAYHTAITRGATAVSTPTRHESRAGTLVRASVKACGDVIHSFIERESDNETWFLPSFEPVAGGNGAGDAAAVNGVDHVAISVAPNTLEQQVAFYKDVFGFSEAHEEYVTTGATAMKSKVVESGDIRLPLVEPVPGPRRSQVEEYIRYNGGPGVQHVAFLSEAITHSVSALRARGIDFLRTPQAYYDMLIDRVGRLDEDLAALRDLNILVDKDPWGYLMQIFSKPIQARPTFFVEIIQRKGARGFGSGNIRALFEAVEREQARRGTL